MSFKLIVLFFYLC